MSPDRAPSRTPEQHALARRRALPVAIAGVILGAIALALNLTTPISAFVPPSLLAANLAFCAMLIGAAMLFYVRTTPRTRPAAVASIASLLLGMTSTFLFTWQAVQSRQAREDLELANLRAIATAAGQYAAAHQDVYPPNFATLLADRLITPQTLQSPYGQHHPLLNDNTVLEKDYAPESFVAAVDAASDYLYLAGDLNNVPQDAAPALLAAVSKNTIMRVNLAVAFADNTSRMVTIEDIGKIMSACNAARNKLGLGAQKVPPIIQSALDEQ